MERNQNIHLVKGYFPDWVCQDKEYLYCPLKQTQWIMRAYYRLHNNDLDLFHLTIGWPLPTESALEAVVEAIKCNKTVVTLVISHGHLDLFPEPWRLSNEPPWWRAGHHRSTEKCSGKEHHYQGNMIEIHTSQLCQLH